MPGPTLEQRIERLEALDAIRQLPAKYALALDMRDMDAMVSLFPADVRVGKGASGREALRAYMDGTLRAPFTGTSHHIGGHIIEFDDADHAHGIVYSKNEHETPVAGGADEWVIMQMMYVDDYVRAETVLRMRQTPGERTGMFRQGSQVSEMVAAYRRAEAEAEILCF